MNLKTTLIALASTAGVVWVAKDYLTALKMIDERFPNENLDIRTIEKAYRTMIVRGLMGKYNSEPDASDETHDRIFLDIVQEIRSK
jgi:hypothetical protein